MVSVILPVKDEPNITHTVIDLMDTLHDYDYDYEIIVVTGDRNKAPLPPLPSYVKKYKSYADSLERAILLGFSVAQGSKIIVMDADGSHPPEVVPQMIKELKTHEMVVGSRFVKNSKFTTSIFRRLVTYIFTIYARLLGSTLNDPMSGYFGIQSQLLTKITFKPITWKIALEINNKLRPKTKEIPINFKAFTDKNRGIFHHWKIGFKILLDILESAL